MPFEPDPERLYLMGLLSKVRRHVGGLRAIGDLAKYYGALSSVNARFGTQFKKIHEIDECVSDFFNAAYEDSTIKLPLFYDALEDPYKIVKELVDNKYLQYSNQYGNARITAKSYNFLLKCLATMDNDVSSRRKNTHARTVLRTANILDETIRSLGLEPTAVPSFPLLGTGVQSTEKENINGRKLRLIPDLVIKINSKHIPPELGLSNYLGVEIQLSHYDELAEKQIKYDTLAAVDPEKPITSSLYPLYILRNKRLNDPADRSPLMDSVGKSIMKRISDSHGWIKFHGTDLSYLSGCENSFLPFFNIGVLDDREISFMRWPGGGPYE